jgi:hypothetical protein
MGLGELESGLAATMLQRLVALDQAQVKGSSEH